MSGRESVHFRGYLRGVSAMMSLLTSNQVKRLDKTNIIGYARELVENEREREANDPRDY
jgi:hypothetical protein